MADLVIKHALLYSIDTMPRHRDFIFNGIYPSSARAHVQHSLPAESSASSSSCPLVRVFIGSI